MLLWNIKETCGTKKIVAKNEWKYHDPKLIQANDGFEIVWAKRSREERNINRLDFNRMVQVAKDEKFFRTGLLKDLDTVRKLRNKIHIGGLKNVTKIYTEKDMLFVMETLEKIMRSAKT